MEVMTTPRNGPGCRIRRGAEVAAVMLASATALLAGCQTTPATGRELVGDVVAVPRTRAELTQGASHANLHAAVRAGVGPADAGAQRLVQASCALPDPSSSNGTQLYTITPLLAAGTRPAPGMRLVLRAPGDPFAGPRMLVRLRSGADKGSLQAGPLGEGLGRVDIPSAPGAARRSACHQ